MRWFIGYFLGNLERTIYILLSIGFITGGISCAASELTCSETIKSAIPIAISINLIASIYYFTIRDDKPINRPELLRQYEAGDITTKNMLQKYGSLMAATCITLFWAGWFSFGFLAAFLIILFADK